MSPTRLLLTTALLSLACPSNAKDHSAGRFKQMTYKNECMVTLDPQSITGPKIHIRAAVAGHSPLGEGIRLIEGACHEASISAEHDRPESLPPPR